MWGYCGDMGWGFGFFGSILMVIFWIIIIWAVVAFIKAATHHEGRGGMYKNWGHDRSLDILKERYAKGEITQEEFEKMKKILQG